MQKKSLIIFIVCIFGLMSFFGCAETKMKSGHMDMMKATEASFKAPVITLDSVELAHYWGYWYFKGVEPTKGDKGAYGAPLDFAFIINMENPNDFPIKMESLKFTVAFEEFDLNTVQSIDAQWIPPGKTNQIRVNAMFDVQQSLLSLLVTGGFQLKQKGTDAFTQLETWWRKAPELGFPIHIKEGSAVFEADGITKVQQFAFTFP